MRRAQVRQQLDALRFGQLGNVHTLIGEHVVKHLPKPVETGPIWGRSIPSGSSTVTRRCSTSSRAKWMSTPSSNVTTTCERPNLEIDRSNWRPGRPLIACSTGNVICVSISSGESRRRYSVDLHLSRRRVGKGVDVQMPQRTNTNGCKYQDAADRGARCRSEKSMMELSIDGWSLLTPHRCNLRPSCS